MWSNKVLTLPLGLTSQTMIMIRGRNFTPYHCKLEDDFFEWFFFWIITWGYHVQHILWLGYFMSQLGSNFILSCRFTIIKRFHLLKVFSPFSYSTSSSSQVEFIYFVKKKKNCFQIKMNIGPFSLFLST